MSNNANEPVVRTTGRIKKPKAVFDPSDNYLPRAQRLSSIAPSTNQSSAQERRASYTKTPNISPTASSEHSNASAKEACVICKKRESKRPIFANKNPILSCLDCEKRIHKLCLKVDFEDFENLQHYYKCDQCCVCKICNAKFNNPNEEMITCSKCVKSYHFNCFPTKIVKAETNLRTWKCNKCQICIQNTNGTNLPVKKIREIIGGAEPVTPTSPPKSVATTASIETSSPDITSKNGQTTTNSSSSPSPIKTSLDLNKKNDSIKSDDSLNNDDIITPPPEKRTKLNNHKSPDTVSVDTQATNHPQFKTDATNHCYSPNENLDDIPDVKQWTVEQVYEYFLKHFPKEAQIFKNEEIDGRSLLLLKRSDIVKKLPIKLGPSLRIYSLILKIQAQLNDPTLGWNCGL